jgi:putative transposase
MRTEMILDAIGMARWGRGAHHNDRRCHSDAGSQGQFTSIRYGERLAEIGATPSIGTVGNSYGNALAETVNGYYKTELVRGPARSGPWRAVEDLELVTLGWVPLAQHATPSRLSRRRPTCRVRADLLCWPNHEQSAGGNQIA